MGTNESRPGYRVILVHPGSPGAKAGLHAFLDFIVSINGTNILESALPFQELIKVNENCCVTLGVLSLLTLSIREIEITPARWEGEGLLGLNLRYEDANVAFESILHVTNVFDNSPASKAGLLKDDFIVGSKETMIRSSESIHKVIEANKKITLAVYNKLEKALNFIVLESFDGSIGIEVATGALHRISDS